MDLSQGDALACLAPNIALEKVVRSIKIQTTDTMYRRTTQLLAYTDDVDIVGRVGTYD